MPVPFSGADPIRPTAAESVAEVIAMFPPLAGIAPLHPAAAESVAAVIALPAPAAA